MLIVSKCLSDKTRNNYNGQVIDNSHSLVGSDSSSDKPLYINTDNNGTVTIIIADSDEDNINLPTIYTSTKSGSFIKDCDNGFTGTLVPYSITVNSLISQLDADTKALQKLQIEGQLNAQSTGSCQCSLIWTEPTLVYSPGSVKIRLVIANATEYRIGEGNWTINNEFIVEKDGEYLLSARNGSTCIVQNIINIRVDPENDLFNIKLLGLVCDANYENEPVISDIKLVDRSCNDNTNNDISNIRFIEETCLLEQSANIFNITLVKAC